MQLQAYEFHRWLAKYKSQEEQGKFPYQFQRGLLPLCPDFGLLPSRHYEVLNFYLSYFIVADPGNEHTFPLIRGVKCYSNPTKTGFGLVLAW